MEVGCAIAGSQCHLANIVIKIDAHSSTATMNQYFQATRRSSVSEKGTSVQVLDH